MGSVLPKHCDHWRWEGMRKRDSALPCCCLISAVIGMLAVVIAVAMVVINAVIVVVLVLCEVVVPVLCCRVGSHCSRSSSRPGLVEWTICGGGAKYVVGGRRCHSWVGGSQVSWKARVRIYSSARRCIPGRCARLVIVWCWG